MSDCSGPGCTHKSHNHGVAMSTPGAGPSEWADAFERAAANGGPIPKAGNRLLYNGIPIFFDHETAPWRHSRTEDEPLMGAEEAFQFMTSHPYRRSQVRMIRSMLWQAAIEKAEQMMTERTR